MESVLVTVNTPYGTHDLELPANENIDRWIGLLISTCELPPASVWSLQYGDRILLATRSLTAQGVQTGAILRMVGRQG